MRKTAVPRPNHLTASETPTFRIPTLGNRPAGTVSGKRGRPSDVGPASSLNAPTAKRAASVTKLAEAASAPVAKAKRQNAPPAPLGYPEEPDSDYGSEDSSKYCNVRVSKKELVRRAAVEAATDSKGIGVEVYVCAMPQAGRCPIVQADFAKVHLSIVRGARRRRRNSRATGGAHGPLTVLRCLMTMRTRTRVAIPTTTPPGHKNKSY